MNPPSKDGIVIPRIRRGANDAPQVVMPNRGFLHEWRKSGIARGLAEPSLKDAIQVSSPRPSKVEHPSDFVHPQPVTTLSLQWKPLKPHQSILRHITRDELQTVVDAVAQVLD